MIYIRLSCLFIALMLCFSSCTESNRTTANSSTKPSAKPNIIFILADDLGYGDLGCFGQQLITTPNLDRMASEGIRFTQFYAGASVCAPSRCVLMTGQHTGHAWVRGNRSDDANALRSVDTTVAEKLKSAGYTTALCGKWGLGEIGTDGHPNKRGFDYFYGYLNQAHAHNYYPPFLFQNETKVSLRNVPADNPLANNPNGSGWAKTRVDYSHDLIMSEAMNWINSNHKKPFFLYLALTIPHANNEARRGINDGQEVPSYGDYATKPWSYPDKGQAAMISRMDRDVGRLMAQLKELGVDDNTLIIFTSDNGPHKEGKNDPELFNANGPLRGMKRDLYDGGIRVPTIIRWPGKAPAGTVSDYIGHFADFMPTACDLAGIASPETDGLSLVPTITGHSSAQKNHDYLYWEFYEQGSRQAVRFGNYKAIRAPMFTGKVELFDINKDIGETTDISQAQPDLVMKAITYMEQAHVPNPNWTIKTD